MLPFRDLYMENLLRHMKGNNKSKMPWIAKKPSTFPMRAK
ncbi:hypothetical protein SBF1_3030003 [Candidatus Desulfosporosinus infrequens]|uniref:Uncharacterized protein n=1 Tax=Candidatus Desulfosporosinus infrequens TaxID=2043169 RepID=A0A2U3KWW1_9FIRM|nr:hypothetical protein SBF1_3030003 [Candidatus Desulfosporosinus infrequens]